jgi:alpha-L-fucosidase 2
MLLQSQTGVLELLPALPKTWASGSVRGLRARGAYTVDLHWKDGRLTNARVASLCAGLLRLRCGELTAQFPVKAGQVLDLDGSLVEKPSH